MIEDGKTVSLLDKGVAQGVGGLISTRLVLSVPKVPEAIGRAQRLDYDGYVRSVEKKWGDLIRQFVPDDPILHTTTHGRTTAFLAIRAYFWFLDIEEGFIPADRAEVIVLASEFHDSGKTPEIRKILRKPGKLTEEEREKIKEHAGNGADRILDLKEKLLRWIDDPQQKRELEEILDHVSLAVRYHHERIDGEGYFGRKKDDIPAGAQIVSVAETFAAKVHGKEVEKKTREKITFDGRPMRKGRRRFQKDSSPRSFTKAIGEIRTEDQGRWEPKIVDALTYAVRHMTALEKHRVKADQI
jgi:hypothetical protein